MARLRYEFLGRIGEEAVLALVEEGVVFDHVLPGAGSKPCCNEAGFCVVGELLRRIGKHKRHFPRLTDAKGALGYYGEGGVGNSTEAGTQASRDIQAVMKLNDQGRLRKPEQVRAALLVEEEDGNGIA